MEVSALSDAHFRLVGRTGAQVEWERIRWNRHWFFSSRATVTSLWRTSRAGY